MTDTTDGSNRDDEARQKAQERRTAEGKDPKSHGPGGNPDKSGDTNVDVNVNPA